MKYRKVTTSVTDVYGLGYVKVKPPYHKFQQRLIGITVGTAMAVGLFYFVF
jgi:hypothetical protein